MLVFQNAREYKIIKQTKNVGNKEERRFIQGHPASRKIEKMSHD